MSLDQIIAKALQVAIAEGRISAVEGVPGACHVLVQHRIGCPVRRSQGREDRCTCGDAVQITLHAGEHADCATCAERGYEH